MSQQQQQQNGKSQRRVNQVVVKKLYEDFYRQMYTDVVNVVDAETEIGRQVHKVIENIDTFIVYVPAILSLSDFSGEISGVPYCVSDDDAEQVTLTIGDVSDIIDEKWRPMLEMYAWLIVSSAHVYVHPKLLPVFRRIATSEAANEEELSDDDETFNRFMRNLISSRASHNSAKQTEVDKVFESTFKKDGAISKLAQEITDELGLEDKLKSPDDVLKLLDTSSPNNILSDVITTVGTKLHSKLVSKELDQDSLVREAMEMMSSLHTIFPSNDGGNVTPSRTSGGRRQTSAGDMLPNLMQIMSMMPHISPAAPLSVSKKNKTRNDA